MSNRISTLARPEAVNPEFIGGSPFTAVRPSEHVSGRYSFISTARFIEDMKSFGYALEATRQPKRGMGMHSMTFSHPSLPNLEGLRMRILATNSHNGTSAFNLYVKVEVQVCSNGLVAFRDDADASTRIVHRGYTVDKVGLAIQAVNSKVNATLEQIKVLQAVDVTPTRGVAFIRAAAELRDAKPFRLTDLADVRHAEQQNNTAWNVFNRVQESLIRGGYKTIEEYTDSTNTVHRIPGRRAKEVTAVKDRLRINRSLWQLAIDELLKQAA